jgi:hypothetical protein
MRLVKIDSKKVTEEEAAQEKTWNSYFHTAEETPGLINPIEAPYSFARWLPLIARSQNISNSLLQTIVLTRSQAHHLLEVSKSSLITGELSRTCREDLEDNITPSLSTLRLPPEGLFLRLDACSTKDGVQKGKGTALHSADEILLRITTSARAMSAIRRAIEDRNASSINLFFLPHNPRMESKREYRVFCPPPTGIIAAVSQYKWHQPSMFSDRPADELDEILGRIMKGIEKLHGEILEEIQSVRGVELDALLLRQGFSFDVFYDEATEQCPLVELNIFGARSGLGSCLFHWIRDIDVLYGKETGARGDAREVEFRISV